MMRDSSTYYLLAYVPAQVHADGELIAFRVHS